MNSDQLDRFVAALPDRMSVKFYGQDVECEIEEHGMQVNGYYVALGTTSPEGYHTKFVLFDAQIMIRLSKYLYRPWSCVISSENRVTFIASPSDAEGLRSMEFGELCLNSEGIAHTLLVDEDNYFTKEVVDFMQTSYRAKENIDDRSEQAAQYTR